MSWYRMPTAKAIAVLMSGAGDVVQRLFTDTYSTNRTVGNVNGTANDGFGSRTRSVTDGSSVVTISSDKLQFGAGGGSPGDPSLHTDIETMQGGLGVFIKPSLSLTSIYAWFGWNTSLSSNATDCYYFAPGTALRVYESNVAVSNIGTYSATDYSIGIIDKPSDDGFYYVIKGGTYTNWSLVWVSSSGSDASMYPSIVSRNLGSAFAVDYMSVAQLYGDWTTNYGLATDVSEDASANDTINTLADCFVDVVITASTGVTQQVSVRYLDDDNRYYIKCDQTASQISIVKVESATETTVGAAVAQTWTDGTDYQVRVRCYGSTIDVFVDTSYKQIATSQTFQQTQTGAKISHNLSAGNDFVAYPYTIPTDLATQLDEAVA